MLTGIFRNGEYAGILLEMVRVYLLNLTEFHTLEELDDFCQKAVCRVDGTRREKALHIRGRKERALSLGAGLLLQLLAAETPESDVRVFTGPELLNRLKQMETHNPEPMEIHYCFGAHGKPAFADFSVHFSLSHSGDYVLCAASENPVGADIQLIRTDVNVSRLAERFFPEIECNELREMEDEAARRALFYRFWTRREAYAKLTGEGLPPVLGRSLPTDIEWIPYDAPRGYACCICEKKTGFVL